MLKIGDPAPDFELKDDQGTTVRLTHLLKSGPLLLYFYPADFTPTCTKEACMFRDSYQELLARGIQVLGVNAFSVGRHADFRSRYGLPFPLLSDKQRTVISAYGAKGWFGFVKRISYFIGADGRILDAASANLGLAEHQRLLSRLLERAENRT